MAPSSLLLLLSFLGLILGVLLLGDGASGRRVHDPPSFGENYKITWGENYVSEMDQGREIQLSMDKLSGSGFDSKWKYTSGFFHLRMKLPDKDSAGVVTAFYLSSQESKHDELDFEFLGNREGKPYTLQTNVFANGYGNREQRIHLWFDPTAQFHDYRLLWNQYQIVVFKNKTDIGVDYPSKPLQIIASLWDGENWATDGGQTKTDWTQAPFTAQFQGFDVAGCPADCPNDRPCSQCPRSWWDTDKFSKLNSAQQAAYENVKEKFMNYDYCSDRPRYPTPPSECPQ